LFLEKYAPDDKNPPLCCPVYIDTYIFRWNGSSLVSDGRRKQRRLKLSEPNKTAPLTTTGYLDVIEMIGSGSRIRFISGDRSYTGIISFDRLSAVTGRRIRSYEDALAFFEGKRINITLSDIAASSDGISTASFGGISRMTVLTQTTTIKTQQRWNERTTATETIIDLSTDILFDFNKSTINPNAIPSLIKLARLIRQSNSNTVQVNGFTDAIGTDEYNIDLSKRRSDTVKNWLVNKGGVDAGRLNANGYGKGQPVAPNTHPDGSDNPIGRQKNRRVEIRISRNYT
jgi:outer membrane protein OmpA-like peptidoglycan-associated protein